MNGSISHDGSCAGPDGWRLDPDGAAVHADTGTAVVADVHLGYEWARARGGDSLPPHSLAETLAKLDRILTRACVSLTRLVVAGDLVESPRPCLRTARDLAALRRWLDGRGITLAPLQGNHDPPGPSRHPRWLDVAGWTVAHGHEPIDAPRTITGHHHPVLRAGGLTAPCFLVGPSAIVLPAFSPNAAGVALERLDVAGLGGPDLRCLAAAGGELLDFGPVDALIRALHA